MSTENESGTVKTVDIQHELRTAYLDYAMSVIVARALPDARDGLKPVQRRILYAMHDMGVRPTIPHKKSARIVGEVLGKYHPHGDSAVYEAMARMAQDFSMRYMLVDGQGNFGSIDGDSPAAMRYTEARLSPIAMEMLNDIEKETVAWVDNFDGSLQEPTVLPARLPNLLVNGASGIAVGMATNIPPHNLGEIVDALVHILDHWDRREEISVEELMEFVKGPDFPTGGQILGQEPITKAYATGRGKAIVRAVANIEEMHGGRFRIVITEIPYQLNKSSLLERIAALVREGKLDEIGDLRDESDKRGMSIIIELKRGVQPQKALNRLYKHTPLQSTFGIQLLALVDGVPRILPLRRLLQVFLDHRIEVLVRRSQYDLNKAQARAHIVEGLLIALDHLDEIIRTIRESPDVDVARDRLMAGFGLTEVQAQAILDMQLRRLTGLERQKLEEEYAELLKTISYLEGLLASPLQQRQVIRQDLIELRERYGDPRRTVIRPQADASIDAEDLVEEESVLISITQRGYIKRMPWTVFRAQERGGRGVIGMTTGDEDEITTLLSAHSHDTVLFFTDKGKVYQEKVYQIPDAGRTSKGSLIAGILAIEAEEHVTAVVPVATFDDARYLSMVTRRGRIKRVALSEFNGVRPSGLIAISLNDGDELGWVRLTQGNDDLILVTEQGMGLRFNEQDVRPMGRTAAGVSAIRLQENDRLTIAEVVEPNGALFLASGKGFGRCTALDEFRTQGRGGKGVYAYRVNDKTGPVVDGRVVQDEDEVTLMSENGIVLRTRVDKIPKMGRYTRGVQMINLSDGDRVATLARLPSGGENGGNGAPNGGDENLHDNTGHGDDNSDDAEAVDIDI
ncbi:MAG TPA: DNA gyrase subunit A [Anaerolineae bacterium]|nr:DNA gyrase subunit A [Anaerolineae bacterium]HQH37872.1 DNA gyrase subunit A [Anaerolineae bacterium]